MLCQNCILLRLNQIPLQWLFGFGTLFLIIWQLGILARHQFQVLLHRLPLGIYPLQIYFVSLIQDLHEPILYLQQGIPIHEVPTIVGLPQHRRLDPALEGDVEDPWVPREGVGERIGETELLGELADNGHGHPLEQREGEHLVEHPDRALLHLRRGRVQPGRVGVGRHVGQLQPVPSPLAHLLSKEEAGWKADVEVGAHKDPSELRLLLRPPLDDGFRVVVFPGDEFEERPITGGMDETEEVGVTGDEGAE